LVGYDVYVGDPAPVITEGRAPVRPNEIALGRATARRLDKAVGDRVEVGPADGPDVERLTVVGIAVLDDPVDSARNAGDGAFVTTEIAAELSGSVPQSIAVRFEPHIDEAAAIARLSNDFPGSIRLPQPQADLRNLQRLRLVPWLLAGLVAAIAFAALVHSLSVLLRRHRRDLAILATEGMTRSQQIRTGAFTALVLGSTGVLVGLPLGVAGGRVVWLVLTDRISVPSTAVISWPVVCLTAFSALAVAGVVALAGGWWQLRRSPADVLNAE
jgi:ABC-type lipoprotein release transport system permease subunit